MLLVRQRFFRVFFMTRYFTHCWSHDKNHAEMHGEDIPMGHTPGSQFTIRGVKVGDMVYVVSNKRGILYVVGKMEVGEILFSDGAAKKRLGYEPWPGQEHLIAIRCTPTECIKVPLKIVKALRFETASGEVGLKFIEPGVLDRQTVRRVRELTYESSLELDKLLPKMERYLP
jgi:hypothetical protein